MIQMLDDMIRILYASQLKIMYSYGFTHDWCTLIPAFELVYKTSIHALTGKTPSMLEKGWNPKLMLKIDLVDINPTSSSLKLLLDTVSHPVNQRMTYSFEYSKQKWDKSHKTPEFKLGDLILVSTLVVNNIKGTKKLKDTFTEPFIIKALHYKNSVQLELTRKLENKYPAFPVSLVKHYT
ncbi:hypothetical protein O181_004607 [Austropuccinia psidii MF-1]|uniref:Integrase catalytic domain-containing protein n=1 Tax=Austropuccinia psidii MF-1 TaxID=1389203 RepID=A0A9Q3GFY4_9BASI|nr:hypothetical protein [Austropuccinia psidii MF-1]